MTLSADKMKAIVYSEYGPAEVLSIAEIEKPAPRDNEVLIRVHAAEATKSDCEMRSFNFQVKWFWLPLRLAFGLFRPKRPVLGGYFSGTVAAIGDRVEKFQPGDELLGCAQLKLGAYGEYMCLPEDYTMVHKPAGLSFEDASALPLGGLNALHFLRMAKIQPGDKVLINGAGASIGTFGVQIAKTMGAQVTAVDSAIKKKMLLGIGADEFIDYTKQDFSCSDERYDVIFSMVAGTSYRACIRSLKPGGRYLLANPRVSDMLRGWLTSSFSDKDVYFALAGETQEELQALVDMVVSGEIRSVVDTVFPMRQATEAHIKVETEQRLGTIVISMTADT